MTMAAADLRSPDQARREAAARLIWERYSAQLLALTKRRLDPRIQRREGPEDVLQSAFGSFFDGHATLNSREDLWRLLVRITLCKVANTAKYHTAARRDYRREQVTDRPPDGGEGPDPILEIMDANKPTPLEALVLTEELDGWLEPLTPEHRRIAQWRLEGYSNQEISVKINRTVRAVELKLQIIRQRLEARYQAVLDSR
jgi:RNA polymerase sigma-70 factor (ECF subfamily)